MTEVKKPEDLLGKQIDVLDHGFVILVDAMGNDSSIVQAARVSYGSGTKAVHQDKGLIRYLMRHRHTTPFEMVEFKFHIKLPIFVARQWIRHRTANVNEYSARYSILEDEFYIPEKDIMAEQSSGNRQGRDAILTDSEAQIVRDKISDLSDISYDRYKYLLNEEGENEDPERGKLARELSRIVIPTNVYTQWYWKIDLHNLFHFLSLRLDTHAQYEIRVYAEVMAEMVKQFIPIAYEAFEDYNLNAMRITGPDREVLKKLVEDKDITRDEIIKICEETGLTNKRERAELLDKLGLIFGEIRD